MITTLIDKQDNFEIVRDKIAQILANETVNQQALAVTAGKDPDDWKLQVYSERSNPWEKWLNVNNDSPADKSPIVNVWLDNSNFDESGSDVVKRQKSETIYNIDCYGLGISTDETIGHTPGDMQASFEAQRATRLVRNILMAAQYVYLDMRGLVWQRWPQSVTSFQPQIDARNVQHVHAVRLALRVRFNEESPQVEPAVLEFVAVDIKRKSDGQIIAQAHYDYTI